MLDPADAEFFRQTRAEMTHLRTYPMVLTRTIKGGATDPFTGDTIDTTECEQAEGTFRRITSGGAGSDDIVMVDGVVAEAGDAIANLDISYDMRGVTHIEVYGANWRVRATDEVGLMIPNRHYVLLKKVT